MSMGMLKRKRDSPPLPDAPASKKVSREDSPALLGANGEPLEVLPDREEVVLQEPMVVKQQVGQPHSSVLAVVQAERAVESVEERDVEIKVPLPSLENISHGQLVPLDLPGGARPGQSGVDVTLPSQKPKLSSATNAQKSADTPVHLIPCHAGWFSWTSINVLERRGLPEFFDGKSKLKTPQIYLEHRNAIICKYRENFGRILTIDDMKEILIGDGNAATRIIEFLDHWGIINYQAAPDSKAHLPDWLGQAALIEEAPDRKLQATALPDPPLQSLYAFESTRAPVSKPAPEPCRENNKESGASLLDAKVAEALSFSDGPAVEYHCNGCAADCSKHRYHCQKQADFDLCPDCYNDGKFGEGMTSTDFIRMDALTDTADSDGGGWTDQETLLLLEALELFGDNWTEIAEHVATKSKSQCILHFIRLPIEDPFLEEMETPGTVTSAPAAPRGSESRPVRAVAEKGTPADAANASAGAVVLRKDTENSASTDNGHRPKESGGPKAGRQSMVDSKTEEVIAFADAGNPVMTQVAFLAAMVGPRVAASAAQSALMALSGVKPAANLANRNCFVLDPPEFDWSKPGPAPSKISDSKPSKATEEGKTEDDETASQQVTDKEGKGEDMDASVQEMTQDSKESVTAAEDGNNSTMKEVEESPRKNESLELEPEAGIEAEDEEVDVDDEGSPDAEEADDVTSAVSVRRAAAAALAAAAVKSKLLADQEEREIQHLVGIVIENQLRKLEVKLKHFSELEVMLAKECDQVDRTRQKYIAERQRLISSRLTPSTQSQTAAMSNLFPVSKPLPAGLTAAAAAASSNLSSVQTGLAQPASSIPGSSGIPRPQQLFPFNKPGGHPPSMAPYGNRPAVGVGVGPGPGPPTLQHHPGVLSGNNWQSYYSSTTTAAAAAAQAQQQQQQQEGSGWFHVPQGDGADRHR